MQAYCIKTEIKNFRSGGKVCTPPILSAGEGDWTSNQILKKGGGAWQDVNF